MYNGGVAEKAHILVLEDQPETQVLLQKQLGSAGYRVTIAADGLAGLMKLEQIKPDLIIIDILMPKLNGLDFARAIRQQESTRAIPTIFLTAKDDPQSMVDGINAGAPAGFDPDLLDHGRRPPGLQQRSS